MKSAKKKGGGDRSNLRNQKYYINAQQQMPVPYGSMLHIPPTNLLLLAAKQEPCKKAYLLTKNFEEFSRKKFRRMDQQEEKRWHRTSYWIRQKKRREETVKWNQMTALRFQTGGRHKTSPASLRGLQDKVKPYCACHKQRLHTLQRVYDPHGSSCVYQSYLPG